MGKVLNNIRIDIYVLSKSEYKLHHHENTMNDFLYTKYITSINVELKNNRNTIKHYCMNNHEIDSIAEKIKKEYNIGENDYISFSYKNYIHDSIKYRYIYQCVISIDDLEYDNWKIRVRDNVITEILK